MATPFSRTIRSLEIDNYYMALTGLLVAILLLIIWGHWFFTARITFYENSQTISVTDKEVLVHKFPKTGTQVIRAQIIRERLITAEFPSDSSETIKAGQSAFVRLDGKIGKKTGLIPATVVNVTHGQDKETVILRASIDASAPNPFKKGKGGEVKIEVEQVTPVTLVLRASGLLTETAPISYSSQ